MPGDQRNHLFLVSCGSLKPLVSELRCSVMEFLPEERTTLCANQLLVRTLSCVILDPCSPQLTVCWTLLVFCVLDAWDRK